MGKDILKINRAKWRTGDDGVNKTGEGITSLLNRDGYMCCLGFHCNQLGIPKPQLLGKFYPRALFNEWRIPDLLNRDGSNTMFCDKAVGINDDPNLKSEEREKRLAKLFSKKKIKVVFTGKYPTQK